MIRSKLVYFPLLIFATILFFSQTALSAKKKTPVVVVSDRDYWTALLYKMAAPVLSNMSQGTLQKNMVVELSPVFGRSMTYRLGVFQPLALLAWKEKLPEGMTNGQARAVMTACMKRMFACDSIFNEASYLQLGFAGQPPVLDRCGSGLDLQESLERSIHPKGSRH